MRINTLAIENFRSHQKTELELERITAIRGPNAVGKSSIEDALGFLFAGRTMSTGTNGQGADRLIRKGTDKAIVTADLGNGTKARASLTEKGGRSYQAKGDGIPSIDRNVWSCLCSTRYFGRLKPEEQRDLLAGLVVPKDLPYPEDVVEVLGEAFRGQSGDVLMDIDDAYKIAFESRTEVGRRIRDWREPLKPAENDADPVAVREQIKMRQHELDQLRADRTTLLAGYDAATKDTKDLEARKTSEEEVLRSARAERVAHQVDVLSKETLDQLKALMKKQPEQKRLSRILADQVAAVESTELAVERAQNIESHGGTCPTCSQELTGEALQAIYEPLLKANREATAERDKTQAELKALDVAAGEFADAESRIEKHAQAKVGVQRANHAIETAEAKLANITKSLEGAGEDAPAPDTTELDASIVNLESRLERGWNIYNEASMAAQRKIDYDKAWAARKELDLEAAKLTRACEVLGPKGARVKILNDHLNAFVGRMNGLLQMWGYTIDFTLEPYKFLLERGKWQVELDMLSESEKLRFGIAFQVALSMHLQVGFVVIDQMDVLDAQSRSVLFNLLWDTEGIEQAILLLTDEKIEAPAAPGSVFYRFGLKDDVTEVTELRRTAA